MSTQSPDSKSVMSRSAQLELSDSLWELTTMIFKLVAIDPEAFRAGLCAGSDQGGVSLAADPNQIAYGQSAGAFDLGLALAPTLGLIPEPIAEKLRGDK